ncbi:MAG TPA: LysR family transcriptional regulator [Thermoanaerobacterales bacterium]|nr:LysR family transcriptional regulator [Thermoanaerobacterales bacterium]
MDIREMLYIVTIAKENNISRAAEKLFVSQSTVSQTLQQVESRLGCQIFTRNPYGVMLTPMGTRIVEVMERTIEFFAKAEQNIQDIVAARAGRIILGTSLFLSSLLLPALLPHFKEKYPGIVIDVKTSSSSLLENLLLRDEIDVALITLPVHSDKIHVVPLFTERLLLMVSPDNPIAKLGEPIPGEQLKLLDPKLIKDQAFILSPPGNRLRDAADNFFKKQGINSPNIVMINNSIETAKRLAALNVGVAFAPERLRKYSLSPPIPEYFLLDESLPNWIIAVAYNKQESPDMLITKFVKAAKQFLAAEV